MFRNFGTSKIAILAAAAITFSTTVAVFAGGPDRMAMPSEPSQSLPNNLWSMIISTGYTNYSNMYAGDGQTPVARLAIARALCNHNNWLFGIETGVQTGNTMRLEENQAIFNLLGANAPISTTVKPMLDLLATIQRSLSSHFFITGKAGIAYRRWQFDNANTINDLSRIAFEVQAGAGYQINSNTSVSLLYQGVLGGNPNLTVNTVAGTGVVSNIPTQNGALLSLSTTV